MAPMTGRTLIEGGLLLADAASAARRADLWLEGGRIREIGEPGRFAALEGARRIDASDRLVVPGLVNGHTHAHGALGRGAVADVGLEGFLAASPSINGQRGLDDLALSATLTAVELLKKGCTALFDMCAEVPAPTLAGLHAVAGAYEAVGIRAVSAPMLADHTLYQAYPDLLAGVPEPRRAALGAIRAPAAATSLALMQEAARHWPFDPAMQQLGVAPTIPLFCSDALLQGCAALSAEHGLPIQTHLAESQLQAVVGEQRYGRSLVAHLQHLGVLNEGLSVAHAIWISDDDIARLARAGVTAVHNPLSNLRLGSGIAPVRRMVDAGLAVALGSDGANTSDTQNLFEAARLAVGLSRIVGADTGRWLRPEDAWRMATEGSARVLGRAQDLGRIAPGCAADLVLLDLAQPVYVPLRDPLRQLVFGENGAAVDKVLVAGRLLVDQGRVLSVDEVGLRRRAQAAADRLDALNAEGANLAAALRPWIGAHCCALAGTPAALAGVQRRLPG